jgi:hypothetical protein
MRVRQSEVGLLTAAGQRAAPAPASPALLRGGRRAGRAVSWMGACHLGSYGMTANDVSRICSVAVCRAYSFGRCDQCHWLLLDNPFIFWTWLKCKNPNVAGSKTVEVEEDWGNDKWRCSLSTIS